MTFEVLNETTILVELTFEEMKKYHITYETLDSNNNAIKNILNVIKASDKFNDSEKITIEALPVNDGGCFFILTFTPKKKVRYKMRKLPNNSVFKTDTLDNLLDFVSALKVKHQKNLKYEIYKMNERMNIPLKLDCVKKEDIANMAKLADKEANPLYPVPVLWNEKELEKIYYQICNEQ